MPDRIAGTRRASATAVRGKSSAKASTPSPAAAGGAPDLRHLQEYLITSGRGRHVEHLRRNVIVFSQGETASTVACVIAGRVMLSVVATSGREVVIGVAGAGQFIGEACLAGSAHRTTTATTLEASTIAYITSQDLAEMLREQPALTLQFVRALLTRAVQVETWLVDQMLHGAEQRLVHLLLLLACAEDAHGMSTLPRMSQEVLARMVGTTRSRVNALLQRLRAYGVQPARTGLRLDPSRLRKWRPAEATRVFEGADARPELPARARAGLKGSGVR